MLSHLFKLIWNKKKTHILLIVEIVAAFLVLFGVTSLVVYNLRNYSEPLGFDYRNVWILDCTSASSTAEQIKGRIRKYPQVESVALFDGGTPYSGGGYSQSINNDQWHIFAYFYYTDTDGARTLGIPLVEGRWFNQSDEVDDSRALIINQPLKEAMFGSGNALGQEVGLGEAEDKEKYRIVGIIGNFKGKGEYSDNSQAFFRPIYGRPNRSTFLIKVKPGTDASFEALLAQEIGAMSENPNVSVSYMEEERKQSLSSTLLPMTIALVVSVFLLINVGLGLFGVLNLSIARRRSEIGLRRALGATERGISLQFLGEIWVLASFSLLIGLLFAFQFPLLNVFDLDAEVYLIAIALSVLIIYGLVTLCAWLPSWQAARIHPATALHED
ncbi:MAG: FtsX-like permease family protein [Bacteroidota bacterium]